MPEETLVVFNKSEFDPWLKEVIPHLPLPLPGRVERKVFNYGLNALAERIHTWAVEKGWWENKDRGFPELIALMHSELSEALEAYRGPQKAYGMGAIFYEGGKPEGIAIELADTIIRICDAAARYDIDLDKAIRVKMEYNRTRPYRHGGRRA